MRAYVDPVLGNMPINVIDTSLVCKALEPIWRTKTETASRLRGRLEAVLNWAQTRGYRTGENPARWKGHLQHILARPKAPPIHFASMPYPDIAQRAKLMQAWGDFCESPTTGAEVIPLRA
jgi:hypothetical protein